jgi:hypothetical protein
MACRWIWLSVLFLLAAGCTRYAIVKYAGDTTLPRRGPGGQLGGAHRRRGVERGDHPVEGRELQDGRGLAANLTAALSATYARVRLVHDAAGLGRERCHTLEVELAGSRSRNALDPRSDAATPRSAPG